MTKQDHVKSLKSKEENVNKAGEGRGKYRMVKTNFMYFNIMARGHAEFRNP